jgi:hypothetical protein
MTSSKMIAVAALGLCAFQSAGDPCTAGARACTDVDYGSTVMLQGTVDHVDWERPYATIHLKVEKTAPVETPAGLWRVRGPSPNALLRGGFTQESLTLGREIIVRGNRFKDLDCDQGGCRLQAQDIQPRCVPIVGFVPAGSMRCSDVHESLPLRWTR